ncbi:exonuclease domain-containing protein [Mycobacteroides chelonae]|nr:exonuclease domain-containing protein [Mycobacteroides chelonae]
MSRNLIVVDLETTGLGPQCAPIEVAAINVDTGQVLQFVPHVDLSKVSIEPEAFAINRYFERGVYDVMLNREDTGDMWDALAAMLRDNTFAGSNPAFDATLTEREIGQSTWHHRKADLAAYAAPALGRDPSELPGLADVLTALSIENRCPHSALGDAEAAAKAFARLRSFYANIQLGQRGFGR